jgi:hypothetical protein
LDALNDPEDTPDSKCAQQGAEDLEVNSGVQLEDDLHNPGAYDYDEIKDVPQFFEVLLFQGDQLDDRLDSEDRRENIVDYLDVEQCVVALVVPLHGQQESVADDHDHNELVEFRVLREVDHKVDESLASGVYL